MNTGATVALICPHCDHPAVTDVKGRAVWDGSDPESNWLGPPSEYALLQCQRCWNVILVEREDYGNGFEAEEFSTLYPATRRLSSKIPADLAREWEEARTCFMAKAYSASLVMVRRTIEGTCKANGIDTRNLSRALKELRENGLIDETLADWADALRIAGNKGAHFTGQQTSREDADDALAFAEALLDHLYVLRLRFQEFQHRLKSKSASASD